MQNQKKTFQMDERTNGQTDERTNGRTEWHGHYLSCSSQLKTQNIFPIQRVLPLPKLVFHFMNSAMDVKVKHWFGYNVLTLYYYNLSDIPPSIVTVGHAAKRCRQVGAKQLTLAHTHWPLMKKPCSICQVFKQKKQRCRKCWNRMKNGEC